MPVKSKRLTNKEKALKAKTKKELQKQGLLPPDKPRLKITAEIKKFHEEAKKTGKEVTVGDMCKISDTIMKL